MTYSSAANFLNRLNDMFKQKRKTKKEGLKLWNLPYNVIVQISLLFWCILFLRYLCLDDGVCSISVWSN